MTSTRSQPDLVTARTIFNITAAAAGCLYRVTNSVTVTLAGTVAAAILTGWSMWLARSRSITEPPAQQQVLSRAPGSPDGPAKRR
jgi:hypothetical protein